MHPDSRRERSRPAPRRPRRARRPPVIPLLVSVLLIASSCSSTDEPDLAPQKSATGASAAPARTPGPSPSATASASHPISVSALAAVEDELTGGDLRLGEVRERTASYTSYDVSYATRTAGAGTAALRITGVLNVPRSGGPFPAVVLAHGFIDPALYVRGQGMTRERGFLAEQGYVVLHVDYRNHAESSRDPRVEAAVRLGYTTDVIAAAHALQTSRDVPVDGERIALFGRSMGGGVMMKALEVAPEVFAAGVGWASVSSLEAENFEHFQARGAEPETLRANLRGRHGLPAEDPDFWLGISARPHFDDIVKPVLMVHGKADETCPPRWARATAAAMRSASVDARLAWYDDGHAFGPAFEAAMTRTVNFLNARMPA